MTFEAPSYAAPAVGGEGRTLSAQVCTTDGWPVPHAILTVTDRAGRQAGRAAADANGMVEVQGLEAGSYTVIVVAAGLEPAARTAIVGAVPARLGVITLTRVGGLELPRPGEWLIDPAHTTIRAVARHLGLSRVHARFKEFSGRIVIAEPVELSQVEVTIQAGSIDTGSGDRDAHLRSRDFLYTEQHPEITFRSTGVTKAGGEGWAIEGKLSIRGAERPVRLDTTYLGSGPDPWGGTRCAFEASTQLHRDDFAIDWNQAVQVGIGLVGATLRVELDVQAVLQEAGPDL
jgi:polyisoprenoid-binding protein YceI